MPNYLVTGGAGFIGSNLVKTLLMKGEHVRVVDDLSTGKLKNIKPFLNRIDFLQESLTDYQTCLRAVDGMDFILHQAAIPSVPRSVDDPIRSNDANVTGTVNLLTAAKEKKIKRLVYAASSSAYGNIDVSPKVETLAPQPRSPYAVSKLAGEYYCRAFYECYGLETVALRYFNVFGPNQDPTSQYSAVIPKFITCILRNEQPPVYGDGTQSRDFTFVENNVMANILACSAPKAAGEMMNVACGENTNLLELIRMIDEILGKDIKPAFLAARSGDVKHSLADISKARAILGYETVAPFREGLKRAIEWYRDNP
ncbi:SDR family oxidoreductase [Candidatus Sumerlaeota bacterium]|nr:SDR family oxidoreductase [Candidatus Sumerlaeota bacterium]